MENDKIREAFESYQYVMGKFHEDHIFTVQDVVYCMNIAMQSAQAEMERLKKENEALRCCENCAHFIDNQPGIITDFTYCEECTRNWSKQYPKIKDNWEAKE